MHKWCVFYSQVRWLENPQTKLWRFVGQSVGGFGEKTSDPVVARTCNEMADTIEKKIEETDKKIQTITVPSYSKTNENVGKPQEKK